MGEERKVVKTNVRSMSKKVAIWIIVILAALSIVDIVRFSQNGTSLWIVTYMREHYPYLMDSFSGSGSSSSSNSEAAAAEAAYPEEEEVVVEEVVIYPVHEDGFIFPDSSEHYIDVESLYNLNDFEDYEFKDRRENLCALDMLLEKGNRHDLHERKFQRGGIT